MSLIYSDDLTDMKLDDGIDGMSDEVAKKNLKALVKEFRHVRHIKNKQQQEMYGKSSEAMKTFDMTKDVLEENTRKVLEEAEEEARTIHVNGYDRKPSKNKRRNIDQLPVKEEHHYPTDPLYIAHKDECQELSPEISEEIEHVPAAEFNHRTVLHQFSWTDENGETHIFKADNPNPKLIKGSYLSPSLAAKVVCDKTVRCLPLYRQEKYFKQNGLDFSRQTLSNWSIDVAEQYLSILTDRMKKDLGETSVCYLDETPLEVVQTRAGGGNKECTIFAARSGPFEEKQMIVYAYSPTKKAVDFERILPADYSGVIECDAASNHSLFTKATLSYCLTHARRKFTDIIKSRTDFKQYEKLKTLEEKTTYIENLKSDGLKTLFSIVTTFGALYMIESQSRKFHEKPEEILVRRQAKSAPVFEELTEKIKAAADSKNFLTGSEAKKACSYFLKRTEGLSEFTRNGYVPIDNNPVELAIKPFVLARKNFLFSNTERGAQATAIAFTITQSAILNGLRPEAYLTYVLDTLRREGVSNQMIERLLPYSGQLPEELYLKKEAKPEPEAASDNNPEKIQP